MLEVFEKSNRLVCVSYGGGDREAAFQQLKGAGSNAHFYV